jgi:hypothetical protein
VLRACAKLLRPGGRTAFFSIHPAPGLTVSQRRLVSRHGPPAVASPRTHRELLEAAGFDEITETDYSDEFVTVTQAWIDQWDIHRTDMEAIWGVDHVKERLRGRRAYLRTVRGRTNAPVAIHGPASLTARHGCWPGLHHALRRAAR